MARQTGGNTVVLASVLRGASSVVFFRSLLSPKVTQVSACSPEILITPELGLGVCPRVAEDYSPARHGS
jgi:hypothetical protein